VLIKHEIVFNLISFYIRMQ